MSTSKPPPAPDGAPNVAPNVAPIWRAPNPQDGEGAHFTHCVVLETPFGAANLVDLERNIRFARACMRDCIQRREAPYASHLLYPQPGILQDGDPLERTLGIFAGLHLGEALRRGGALTVAYTNLGISTGMEIGIDHARAAGHPVELRQLLPGWEAEAIAREVRHTNVGGSAPAGRGGRR